MRPIDADAADLKRKAFYPNRYNIMINEKVIRYSDIKKAPTIDYAPVKQMSWIVQDETYTRFQCGSCKSKNFERTWLFCPLCGAQWNGKGQRRHEDDEA